MTQKLSDDDAAAFKAHDDVVMQSLEFARSNFADLRQQRDQQPSYLAILKPMETAPTDGEVLMFGTSLKRPGEPLSAPDDVGVWAFCHRGANTWRDGMREFVPEGWVDLAEFAMEKQESAVVEASLQATSGHLSVLVDQATDLLRQLRGHVGDLYKHWSIGGEYVRGGVALVDDVDDWLAARPDQVFDSSNCRSPVLGSENSQAHGETIQSMGIDLAAKPDETYLTSRVDFSGLPLKKLQNLLGCGWRVNGVMIQQEQHDGFMMRGAVTTEGMVIWWPGSSDRPLPLTDEQREAIIKSADNITQAVMMTENMLGIRP